MHGTYLKYADIEEQCNRLHKIANDLKCMLDEINDSGKKVFSSDMWVGRGADHFHGYLNQLTKNYDEIYHELEASILYLANCSDGYKAVDEHVMNEILNNLNISSPENYSSKVFR